MAKEEYLALLKQGVEVWNQWRKDNPQVIPDLSRANLYQANLRTFNLQKVNLSQANLSYAHLDRSQLNQANLQGANLLQASLCQANLNDANLDLAILKQTAIDSETILNTKIRKVWEIVNQGGAKKNFSNLDLSYANLFRVDLSNSDLSNADLNHANLSNSNLNGAYLYQANLTAANLYNANLENAYLSHADLTSANLSQASLIGAYLRDAIADLVNLQGTKINYQTLIDYKYYLIWELVNQGGVQKNLSGADLSRANLKGIDFSEANLTKVNFANSDLQGCIFFQANLTKTNFAKANLSNVNFSQTNFQSANLSGIISDRATQFDRDVNTNSATIVSHEAKTYDTTIQLVERQPIQKKHKLSKLELGWVLFLLTIILVVIGSYLFWRYQNNQPLFVPPNLERLFPNQN
jgi:uncharacterized protein YjbI with pentapeptide repeats